jgi:hypothetical protein
MKSFLLRGKRPIIRWSLLPDETYFEGNVPEGYNLAVMPSKGYVVVDVDRHGDIDGFEAIPHELRNELHETFNYKTKNNGMHFWFKYSGENYLGNKASGVGIDLRVGCKGYVVWYPKEDVRSVMDKVNDTSDEMNKWLEKLFSYV